MLFGEDVVMSTFISRPFPAATNLLTTRSFAFVVTKDFAFMPRAVILLLYQSVIVDAFSLLVSSIRFSEDETTVAPG